MGFSNNKISAPVSIYDIQQVLGVNSGDDGTLCRSDRINMWAKYKPVRWQYKNTTMALASGNVWNPNAGSGNQWWRADSGNYGISGSGAKVDFTATYNGVYNALKSLLNVLDGDLNGWSYERPHGSLHLEGQPDQWYRIIDFLQYNHAADKPIKSVKTYNVNAGENTEYPAGVTYIEPQPSSITTRDYVTPDDTIQGGATLYRGLAIYRKVNTTYEPIAWCTGTEWIGTGVKSSETFTMSSSDTKAVTNLANGHDYYVLPVYFTIQLPQPSSGQSLYAQTAGSVYAMPYSPRQSSLRFRVTLAERVVIVTPKTIAEDGSYNATISVKNTGSSSYTANYVTAVVNELFSGSFDSGTFAQVTWEDGTDFTVAGGATAVLKTFNVAAGGLPNTHNWFVYLNYGGVEYYVALRQTASNV